LTIDNRLTISKMMAMVSSSIPPQHGKVNTLSP
jgi:hypothetical protein